MTATHEVPVDLGVTHVDVLIVGAGISGIGAAYHLQSRFPDKTFTILEAQEARGGTWWLHRYPGVRSDSDLFTYGYAFKPWRGPAIAAGAEILSYLDEVIEENNLKPHIRYQHKVTRAHWSSEEARWTVDVLLGDTGEQLQLTANFLWMCVGYYRYDKGYTPDWPGMERYTGQIVHPQHWPEDLDYAGKRVVVIGSGATAATLIPSIAGDAEHVTMLQRTPTFFTIRPSTPELAKTLRDLDIPDEWTHEIMRRQFTRQTETFVRMSREQPDAMRKMLIEQMRTALPEGFDVDKHFNPPYRPFQQRPAATPDGDLFAAIRAGWASVVTDTIESFTETGLQLTSGETLTADIIVTATGFNLSVFGEIPFSVDGEAVDFTEHVTFRGLMITGIPNMAFVIGYFRASHTLRSDLISEFVCRLLQHMDDKSATTVIPRLRPEDLEKERLSWGDPDNWSSGYVMRSAHRLYKRLDDPMWSNWNEYQDEKALLPEADLEDGLIYR